MTWVNPLASMTVTSGYGPRRAPVPGASTFHAGTDYRAAAGTVVYAIGAGRVAITGRNTARGVYIILDHGSGVRSLYQHLSTRLVTAGQQVVAGQLIALSGATGTGNAPHLHLEVHVGGTPVNPVPWLAAHVTTGLVSHPITTPSVVPATPPPTPPVPLPEVFMPALTDDEQRRLLAQTTPTLYVIRNGTAAWRVRDGLFREWVDAAAYAALGRPPLRACRISDPIWDLPPLVTGPPPELYKRSGDASGAAFMIEGARRVRHVERAEYDAWTTNRSGTPVPITTLPADSDVWTAQVS